METKIIKDTALKDKILANVESVLNTAGAILPIPGGLMSVVLAILLRNALTSFVNTLQNN